MQHKPEIENFETLAEFLEALIDWMLDRRAQALAFDREWLRSLKVKSE